MASGLNLYRFLVLSPVVRDKKGDFKGLIENLKKQAQIIKEMREIVAEMQKQTGGLK
jgi:hypothetical protein